MNTGLSIVLLRISRRGSGYCAPPRFAFGRWGSSRLFAPGKAGTNRMSALRWGGRTDQVVSKSEFAFDVGRKMDLMPVQR